MQMICLLVLTATDASRAATATMSAHETMPGQMLSTWALTSSMISYPLIEPLLSVAFFSLEIEGASSSKIDASQPCNINNKMTIMIKMINVNYFNHILISLRASTN